MAEKSSHTWNNKCVGTDPDDEVSIEILVNRGKRPGIQFTHRLMRKSVRTVEQSTGRIDLQQLNNLFEVTGDLVTTPSHRVVFQLDAQKQPQGGFSALGCKSTPITSVLIEIVSVEHRKALHVMACEAICYQKMGEIPKSY